MGTPPEKRCEDRLGCEARIKWAYFNKSDFFSGQLLNISPNGGYFLSEQGALPGSTLLIRVQKCISCNDRGPERSWIRSNALCEVKWCREVANETGLPFAVGIRYHLPV
jgi:hypothetical protein